MKILNYIVACALPMLLGSWSSGALAQDDSAENQFELERQSRVHPSSALGGQPPPFAPPTNNRLPTNEFPTGPEKVEPPVTTEELVGAVELCTKVISPQFDVKPHLLSESGWGNTQLQNDQRGSLPYKYVNYYKGNLTISLQDFGKFVDCRAVARISGSDQISGIRTSLIETLGASLAKDTKGLELYVARTQQAAPQTNFDNLLIVKDYLIEFWLQSLSTSGMNVEGNPTLDIVLLSISPLPEKFQMRNRTASAQ